MTARAASLRAEFAPSPDRWRGAMQMTALCVATAGACMILGVPEAALACYLVFFAWRDDSGAAVLTALALVVAVSLALWAAIPLLQLAAGSAFWRLGLLSGLTLVGMTLADASRVRMILGTATFVFAFAITLYDVVPIPDILTRLLAWMWVVVVIPMVFYAALAIYAGPGPRARAETLIGRYRAALAAPDGDAARALLQAAGAQIDGYLSRARLVGSARGAAAARLAAEAEAGYLALARAEAGLPPRDGPPAPAHPAGWQPLFAPSLITDPTHLRFGIKVTVAVLITYFLYTAGDLFEIHTAMITCYFVALGTGAETRHKMTLRLTGAVLGGLLGALVLFFLMPHLTDFGHFLGIVALGAFPAAWISLGSERISYAGWQLALCYFLVILGASGPVTDLSAATDRILGIVVGITVVGTVFSLLWPVSASDRIDDALDRFDRDIAATAGQVLTGRAAMRLHADLAEARRLSHYARYEGAGGAAVAEAGRIGAAHARLHRKLTYATGEPHA